MRSGFAKRGTILKPNAFINKHDILVSVWVCYQAW